MRKKPDAHTTLDYQLDAIQVQEVDGEFIPNPDSLEGWYSVSTEAGIVAYFGSEQAACFFRLALINARLNTPTEDDDD